MTIPTTVQSASQTVTLGGSPSTLYVFTLRVRGVIDLKLYSGGTSVKPFVRLGGTPAADQRTTATLTVSSPSATYRLNDEVETVEKAYNVPLDYTLEIVANGGAIITLTVDNQDSLQFKGDITDQLIDKDPLGKFNGIWLQVDTGPSEPFVEYSVVKGGGVRGWVWSAFAENVYGIRAEE